MRFNTAFLTSTTTAFSTSTTSTSTAAAAVLKRSFVSSSLSSSSSLAFRVPTTTSTAIVSRLSAISTTTNNNNNNNNRCYSCCSCDTGSSIGRCHKHCCGRRYCTFHHRTGRLGYNHHRKSPPGTKQLMMMRSSSSSSTSASSHDEASLNKKKKSKNQNMTGTEIMKAFLKYKKEEHHVANPELLGLNVPMSMEAFVNADCVCFDVDSTVIQEEGIDVLAEYLGKGTAVAQLTKQAMEGGMKFQDALSARLQLLQPSQRQIESCLRDHPFRLTDGIPELMQLLQLYHKEIYLISGGFRIMIEPIAKQLNIDPKTHVIANNILFDSDLLYHGFDTNEYTSQDMGKPKAIQSIIDTDPIRYRKIVMIGDGMTDAQTKPPATTFIGFGGVVVRANVQQAADWFITDFQDLIHLLKTYGPTTTSHEYGN